MQLPRVQEATENIETSPQVLLRQPKASVFVCKESETIPHRCNAVSAFGIFFYKRLRGRYTFFFHFTFDSAHSSVFRNLYNIDFILLLVAPEKQIGSRSGIVMVFYAFHNKKVFPQCSAFSVIACRTRNEVIERCIADPQITKINLFGFF